jgi:hypothetical protein
MLKINSKAYGISLVTFNTCLSIPWVFYLIGGRQTFFYIIFCFMLNRRIWVY